MIEGDKVVIRNDLTQNETGIPEEDLKRYCGKETTIIDRLPMMFGGEYYSVEIDGGFYTWKEDWFEEDDNA
jgi:hypothetical protein